MPEVRFYSGEDKINEEKRLKFKAEMDEAGLIRGERLEAKAEGIAEGREELIKEMLADGVPEEQLKKYMKK